MAAPRGGGNKRKDGDMGRGGGSRGRGAWGRGGPHMNSPYSPNMTPTGMHSPRGSPAGLNGHPSFSNLAQAASLPPSSIGIGNGSAIPGLSSNIGAKISVSLTNGQRFEGTLSEARMDNQFLLTDAREPNGNSRAKLQVMSHQLMSWSVVEPAPVKPDLGAPAETATDAFRTDGDVSKNAPFKERDLVGPGAWANDTSAGLPPLPNFNDGHGSGDDLTFGVQSAAGWDQFAANEKLFGVRASNFDEHEYTTPLDRSGSDYKNREKRAQKIADEIQNGATSNAHIAEERGLKPDDSGINEEDKYSGVARNPNVYVPPAARRAAAAAAAANGSPSGTTKALSPQPAPATLAAKTSSPPPATTATVSTPPAVTVPTPSPPVEKSKPEEDHEAVTPASKPAPQEKTAPAPAAEKRDTKLTPGTSAAPASASAGDKHVSAAAKVPQVTVENPLVQDFRNFVTAEKERLTTQRKNLAKSEKDKRIADLIRFSTSFKLNKEIPEDLVNIITKDEDKKKQILERSKQDAKATSARTIGPAPAMNASASTRYGGLGIAQAANAVKSPAANAIPPSSSASATTSASSKPVKMADKYAISEIPPFNPGKSKAIPAPKHGLNSGGPTSGKATPAAGSTPSTSPSNDFKLNINASSFRPNATAPSFKPVNGASPSPAPAPSGSPARPPLSKKSPDEPAPSQPNPFFGSNPLKKGSVHIKDDFSPFKHNKVAEASSTPSTWPFTGKRYAALLPPQPTPPPPQQMPAPFEDENQQAQMAQAAYMQQMYAGYRYGGYGPPQPGQPPMPMQGHPNGYMPPPQFMAIYGPMPGVPGGAPPAMYAHPMMSPMGPRK
ncbi:hypothetical protein DACRYDRAFT_14026 [Dacryopinax primogenitus]|uniref:LsmAD domain-containing protein n=1 Tax=Dacryopinax primogenitus (strain DJM 731) TaxID=1858805 RepID=M5G808_DACPD|nr:uncharacterized protein DACRYDRAFT_14026 [Dacryopinax primogenitus]EJU04894.1 hypothetical protein DACRYDRAFT_14026 [Dacryopinax primogenitus]